MSDISRLARRSRILEDRIELLEARVAIIEDEQKRLRPPEVSFSAESIFVVRLAAERRANVAFSAKSKMDIFVVIAASAAVTFSARSQMEVSV